MALDIYHQEVLLEHQAVEAVMITVVQLLGQETLTPVVAALHILTVGLE